MNNFKIISLFTLLLFFGVKESSASTFIDAASFGQMSTPDQIIIIDNARDLAIQMEENLKLVVGTKQEKSYQLYVKAILNLIVKSSHAKMKEKAIMSGQLCIYGGWVSIVSGKVDGSSVCTNPKNLSKVLEKKTNYDPRMKELLLKTVEAHADFNFGGECPGASIVCAPHLYGYRDASAGKPFCGQSDTSPYNASMDCSRKVNQLNEADKQQNYLNIIKEQTEDGKNSSNLINMFKIFYDVCACKGDSGLIDSSYAEKIFSQRTCYSWMKQNQLIMSRFQSAFSCKELKVAQPNDEEFKSLFNWMATADKHLQDILEENEQNGTDFFEIIRDSSDSKVLSKTKSEVRKQDSRWATYRLDQYDSSKPQCESLWEKNEIKCIESVSPNNDFPGSGKFTLDIPGAPLTKKELALIPTKFMPFDDSVTISHDGGNVFSYSKLKENKKYRVTLKRKPDVVCEFPLDLNTDASPATCNFKKMESDVKEGYIGYTVSLKTKDGLDKAKFSINPSSVNPDGYEPIESSDGTISYQFLKKQKESKTITHTITYDGTEYSHSSCSLKVEGEKKDDKPADTFKVTIKEKEVKDKTVIYTIDTLTEGDIKIEAAYTDYTFKWSVKKKATKNPDKELDDENLDPNDYAEDTEDKKDNDEGKIEPTVVEKGTGPEIELPKETEEYDVYVEATKSKETQSSEPLKVPTLADAKPAPVKNNANPFQQQMKTPQKAPAVRTKSYQGVF